MAATRWLAPVCSHEPTSNFLDERDEDSKMLADLAPELADARHRLFEPQNK
jgi:hypothetical protein